MKFFYQPIILSVIGKIPPLSLLCIYPINYVFWVTGSAGCAKSFTRTIGKRDTIRFCIRNEDNGSLVKKLTIVYHKSIKRVYIKIIDENVVKSITLHPRMAEMLGFKDTVVKSTAWGVHEPMLTGSLEAMYIYANILEPQIVGDVAAPLLRIVNVQGKYPDIVEKTFDFPHYSPVLVKDISDIEINIKKRLGRVYTIRF